MPAINQPLFIKIIGWFAASLPLSLFVAVCVMSAEIRIKYGFWPEDKLKSYPAPLTDFLMPHLLGLASVLLLGVPVILAFIWSFERGRPALAKTGLLVLGLAALAVWVVFVPAKYFPLYF